MNKSSLLVLSCACLLSVAERSAPAAEAAPPYVADPEPDRPTLHVQPPALTPPASKPAARVRAPAGSVNGITFIDVMTASGFDIGGGDYGNEPALTFNPTNPNQIVLTSFSGSNWGASGNSSLFYSGDGGATWTYSIALPPPPGTSSNINCPCDQNMDWGRDGLLYGTFLHYTTGVGIQSVYSAHATTPTSPASWVYRTVAGAAQRTNRDAYIDVDQPWLASGPLPGDDSMTNVCVAYDNFDANFLLSEVRNADSPAQIPLNFTRDVPANVDGRKSNDGTNPGTRIAVGPTGLIFNVFERYGASFAGGVKQLTYLVTVSIDGGQTWSITNSDHISGAKIIAANVFTFQGNGSKVGGVNALLGGITAITVDPSTGTAWIVYGTRAATGSVDRLWLVPVTVTYGAGNNALLNVGTAQPITSPTINAYLPAVAALPNGEVGVLYLTWSGTQFTYEFLQTIDGGATVAKLTTLATFTSPFASGGATNQRIFGDYLQLKSAGCEFFGTYPARGDGLNSVNSIDPYFMRAPASAGCALPTPQSLIPPAVCAGGPDSDVIVTGSDFQQGTTGRVNGALRTTTYDAPVDVRVRVKAGDIVSPGSVSIDVIGPTPGGILSGGLPLIIESPAGSTGSSLRVEKSGTDVALNWTAPPGAGFYRVKRCTASGPCTPVTVNVPSTNSYSEATLNDGSDYWYLVVSANSCGETP